MPQGAPKAGGPRESKPRYGTMIVSVDEFITRFLLHVVADGMHRIHHFGIIANGCRARVSRTLGHARGLGPGSRRRRARGGWGGGGSPLRLGASGEAEGFRESAARRMDDETDGATPSRAAQVVEERRAFDADD